MSAMRRLSSLALVPLMGLAWVGACSNPSTQCSSPSSGTFSVTLAYAKTIPVAIYCEGASDGEGGMADVGAGRDSGDAASEAGAVLTDGGSCASRPHPFDGASWTIAVNGSTATVTPKGGSPTACTTIAPQASPGSGPDGSPIPGTGCYLLVACHAQAAGDAGAADLQIQIFAQATATDLVVLARDDGASCCHDEYTGVWH